MCTKMTLHVCTVFVQRDKFKKIIFQTNNRGRIFFLPVGVCVSIDEHTLPRFAQVKAGVHYRERQKNCGTKGEIFQAKIDHFEKNSL